MFKCVVLFFLIFLVIWIFSLCYWNGHRYDYCVLFNRIRSFLLACMELPNVGMVTVPFNTSDVTNYLVCNLFWMFCVLNLNHIFIQFGYLIGNCYSDEHCYLVPVNHLTSTVVDRYQIRHPWCRPLHSNSLTFLLYICSVYHTLWYLFLSSLLLQVLSFIAVIFGVCTCTWACLYLCPIFDLRAPIVVRFLVFSRIPLQFNWAHS